MLKRTLTILTLLISLISYAQINQNLKKELDEILYLDQKLRELFDNNISEIKQDSILNELNISKEEFKTKNWGIVIEQDSINLKKLKKSFPNLATLENHLSVRKLMNQLGT